MDDPEDLPEPISPKQQTGSSRIGGSVESKAIRVIISNFWLDDDPEHEAFEVARYRVALKGCAADEILDAFAEYERFGPKARNGRPLKPTPHDLRSRVMKARGLRSLQPLAITHEKPEREPRRGASPEQANEIMAEFGYTPEHIARSKRFPRAASREELEELESADQEQREAHWTESASPDRLAHLERVRNANPLIQEARAAAAAAGRRKANPDDDAA